ncbi:MAG: SLC45 family MFS transporter [Alkalinema sp. RU_4_3]|nr:SLC45 family MFS transporter [Alkalinema sp. RU_4_3]
MSSNVAPLKDGILRWQPLLGLATLQAAITLLWVVYNAYLVQLLGRFGFPPIWAIYLLVIESLVSVFLEPIMGGLSDRPHSSGPAQRQLLDRFPMIAIGVFFTAIFSLAIPLVAMGSGLQTVAAWILPCLIVAWAFCMSIFQSPAMALIGQYAGETRLPQATSVLMLFSVVVRVFSASATEFILRLGPIVAFGLASGSLLVALFLLRWLHPTSSHADQMGQTTSHLPIARLALVFFVGCGIGLTGRSIGATLGGKFLMPGVSLMLVWFLAQTAVMIPAGWGLERWGLKRVLLGSLGLVGLVLVTIARHGDSPWLVVFTLMLGVAQSFILSGTFPFALNQVPENRSGLGIGMYFSGAATAGALFGLVVQFMGKPSPQQAAWLGALGMGMAIAGVVASLRGDRSAKVMAE